MLKIKTAFVLTVALAFTVAAFAAETKTYRAVGKVIHTSAEKISFRTSSSDMEFKRDAKTKINGELRMGAEATIIYEKVSGQPRATEVTVKK
jgi:hypothetical protein